MKITLPFPPSANRYWRRYRNVMCLSAEAKEYRRAAQHVLAQNNVVPIQGAVAITLHFYRPRKSGDMDNRMKQLLDSLQGHAYNDDAQIVEMHAYRHDDKANPRVEIEARAVDVE
jgi:crossover junction endodeoxyribonuclease RusA